LLVEISFRLLLTRYDGQSGNKLHHRFIAGILSRGLLPDLFLTKPP